MKWCVRLSLMLLVLSVSFKLKASDTTAFNDLTRVDDARLHQPFKTGVLQGMTLFLYQPKREALQLKIPTDAQLAIGFEQHLRRHGNLSYRLGSVIGVSYTSFILLSLYFVFTKRKSISNTRKNEVCAQ